MDDIDSLGKYYSRLANEFGDDPRSTQQSDRKTQEARMGVLCEIGDLVNASILDFGCGNGTHLTFFSQMKIKNIYGVDTSKIVKKIRNKRFKIFRISQEEDLTKKFKRKFDIIFSNQVLYYLNDKSINFFLKQFHTLLNKNGLMFTTWMAPIGNYYKLSKNRQFNKLTKTQKLLQNYF